MSEIGDLLIAFEQYVGLPWDRNLAGDEKVWFAVYDPIRERRLRGRIDAFEAATLAASRKWILVDITDAFAEWMACQEYREAYFSEPSHMGLALANFAEAVANRVRRELEDPGADEDTLVAVLGLGSLFGLARCSKLVADIAGNIKGRLLVFFPGQHDGPNWRLLDARDGWNYHAVPISGKSKE